jgi:GAF domain-containing protein
VTVQNGAPDRTDVIAPDRTDVISDAMARIARSVRDGAEGDRVLHSVTAAALDAIPGADFVTITVAHPDGSLQTLAPTGEVGERADQVQYELGEGPCLTAVQTEGTIRAEDVPSEERWPRYAQRAAELGIGSQMAVEIFRSGGACAGLNVYSRTRGAFDESRHIVELFGSQAAIAMNFVRSTQSLKEALASRKTIGQAIGIVMERFRIDEEQAFAFLVRTSQDGNVKLRAVAQRIVELGNGKVDEASVTNS